MIGGLLGEEFNYLGGDGNYYSGDTGWHSDGFHRVGKFLKVALYLDPVTRDTGCLRVIPGTHRLEAEPGWEARQAGRSRELWGIEPRDVPAVALEFAAGRRGRLQPQPDARLVRRQRAAADVHPQLLPPLRDGRRDPGPGGLHQLARPLLDRPSPLRHHARHRALPSACATCGR